MTSRTSEGKQLSIVRSEWDVSLVYHTYIYIYIIYTLFWILPLILQLHPRFLSSRICRETSNSRILHKEGKVWHTFSTKLRNGLVFHFICSLLSFTLGHELKTNRQQSEQENSKETFSSIRYNFKKENTSSYQHTLRYESCCWPLSWLTFQKNTPEDYKWNIRSN